MSLKLPGQRQGPESSEKQALSSSITRAGRGNNPKGLGEQAVGLSPAGATALEAQGDPRQPWVLPVARGAAGRAGCRHGTARSQAGAGSPGGCEGEEGAVGCLRLFFLVVEG